MADLTVGAVNGLLSLLKTVVQEEAGLQGGLRGNMQFIKDEMDSMNGFLLHLTKTESEHDDQIRAWMKQVREIAYVAENCVERYVHDIAQHEGEGPLATARFLLRHPKKYCMRRDLAKKILELKVRVNDIGERRKRYGVKVPSGSGPEKAAEDGAAAKEEKRDAFRRHLEQAIADYSSPAVPSSIHEVIRHLPAHVKSQGATDLVHATWKKCCPPAPDDETLRCIGMLLCALYAYPYKIKNLELERLKKKVLGEEEEEEGGMAEEMKPKKKLMGEKDEEGTVEENELKKNLLELEKLKKKLLSEMEEKGGTAEEIKLKKKLLELVRLMKKVLDEVEKGGTAKENKLKKNLLELERLKKKVLGEEEEEGGTAEEIKLKKKLLELELERLKKKLLGEEEGEMTEEIKLKKKLLELVRLMNKVLGEVEEGGMAEKIKPKKKLLGEEEKEGTTEENKLKKNLLELERLKKKVLSEVEEEGGTTKEIKLKNKLLKLELERLEKKLLGEEEGGTAEEIKLKKKLLELVRLMKKILDEVEEEGETAEEIKLLGEKEEEGTAKEIKNQVMVFCYSLLSIEQKSCLQYLTAFLEEKAISRTSLVRRWVAEGLVGKEQGRTDEEVGERYFNDLLFRGFIRPARTGDAGTVKSCQPLAGSIRTFITSIAASENFVIELPIHLGRQLRIREIVGQTRQQPPQQQQASSLCCWSWRDVVGAMDDYCGCCCCWRDKNPMDDLVVFLKELPELYRLNVLDLGGCRGLKPRHMEAIFTVVWLKYLSLRKTDVSWLPPSHLKKLKLLETLDIRETPHLHPRDVGRMYLQNLKHLLAGRYVDKVTGEDVPTARRTSAELSIVTEQIPSRIGAMRSMETLSHVQVSDDGAELGRVGKLRKLRKLGVVIRRVNHRGAQQLRGVICALAGCLRSLSIWVTQDQGSRVLDISVLQEATSSLVLENLDINGRIGSLPSWVERAGKLANISLRDTEMSGGESLTRLANVLSLRCLKLSRRSFLEQALTFRDDVHFKALKFLVVDGDTITSITFAAAGAAPELEKIVWSISKPHSGDLIISGISIDRLPKLKEIELRGNFNVNNLLQAIGSPPNPQVTRYHCRYVSLSDLSVITVVKKTKSDTTLSLPVGVINQQEPIH